MDDDPSIVASVCDILISEGHEVVSAENARGWAEEIGADGYLAKPFEIDALIAAVERHATRPH